MTPLDYKYVESTANLIKQKGYCVSVSCMNCIIDLKFSLSRRCPLRENPSIYENEVLAIEFILETYEEMGGLLGDLVPELL